MKMICAKAGVCARPADSACAAKSPHERDFFCSLKCPQGSKCIPVNDTRET